MSTTASMTPSERSFIASQGPTHAPESKDTNDFGKKQLADSLLPVTGDLTQLESQILDLIPTETEQARTILKHLFSAGGKRIRPALYFFCCRLFGYKGESLIPIAAVCEYVHTASLLHDDVLDNSSLRRNKPTANSIWGDQASILVGDLIYSRASELMAATGSLEIVSTFARAIRLMSEGELLQLECAFKSAITEDEYFKILDCKTGVLVAACCRAAGILSDADTATKEALTQFGSAVGKAFQLIDDALDYVSVTDLFGKATRADLKEGKVTLPIILLRSQATADEWRRVSDIISQPGIAEVDLDFVCALVEKYETAAATLVRASEYTSIALSQLATFPPSPARDDLENLASKLLWRVN